MKDYKIFDIIGPIMIGPSSSHTAGACRIAKTARAIVDPGFTELEFQLHGSFAATYKGHGTDRALLAGAMGFDTDDVRIRDSFEIADQEGLKYKFTREDLGKVHPNTVKIIFKYPDKSDIAIIGSSIGGGNIEIIDIDGVEISYTGMWPTLIVKYQDQKGVIHNVSGLLSLCNYNIESIKTVKNSEDLVTLIVETNEVVDNDIINRIIDDKRFTFARYIMGA
ncbi:MAG: L-serine ammonia-lyase, iron-sulfur-dependent subunit beta [Bacillota bacterium]|nr:L-serine ammonia-lyase, iron-sulfur-dependent subunit beta [Bacillota bacterium]